MGPHHLVALQEQGRLGKVDVFINPVPMCFCDLGGFDCARRSDATIKHARPGACSGAAMLGQSSSGPQIVSTQTRTQNLNFSCNRGSASASAHESGQLLGSSVTVSHLLWSQRAASVDTSALLGVANDSTTLNHQLCFSSSSGSHEVAVSQLLILKVEEVQVPLPVDGRVVHVAFNFVDLLAA